MDRYFTYNDIQGHYTDEGKGPTILFVHGFAEDGTVWKEFQKAFIGYRILVPHLPGVGGIGLPNAEFTMDMLADYLLALVKDAGVQQLHLVGHSMGGYAALAFAEKQEEMLLSLTMFHSQPFADDAEKKAARIKQAEFVAKNGTTHFIPELYHNLFYDQFVKNNHIFIEGRIVSASTIPSLSIQAALKGMAARPDRAEVLKEIKVPVLFIIGKMDKAIPSENSMKQTHLPNNGEVHLLNEVAHMGMFEKKKECQEIVRGFLDRVALDS